MQPLSQAIPRVVADLLRTGPVSHGKVDFAWKAVVGPAMARVTRVRLEGRVLIVEGQTASWVHEVARSSSLILRRLNNMLGDGTIQEMSFRA